MSKRQGPRKPHGAGRTVRTFPRRHPRKPKPPRTFPWSALLAVALTGFIAILTETLPAGLLFQIARDLDISQALRGQLVTTYALGTLVAAIPLTLATRRFKTPWCSAVGISPAKSP